MSPEDPVSMDQSAKDTRDTSDHKCILIRTPSYKYNASVNYKREHLPPPPGNPVLCHLLSARVPGFLLSELFGGCPGIGPFIVYKYQVVSRCRVKALFSLKLIFHLFSSIYFCFLVTKSASKLKENFRIIKYGTEAKAEQV